MIVAVEYNGSGNRHFNGNCKKRRLTGERRITSSWLKWLKMGYGCFTAAAVARLAAEEA